MKQFLTNILMTAALMMAAVGTYQTMTVLGSTQAAVLAAMK